MNNHRTCKPPIVSRDNPDLITVKPGKIKLLTILPEHADVSIALIKPLHRQRSRDWFTPHFHYCQPLIEANSVGFVVISESDVSLMWNGGDQPSDLVVEIGDRPNVAIQNIHSHFGYGIVTVDHPWILRTSPGINLYIGQPPNFITDGLQAMAAIVETDHLRTDFTFNIKVTRPGVVIRWQRGDPIGFFMPVVRECCEPFELELQPEGVELEGERLAMKDFESVRHNQLKHQPGNHYRLGIDIYGSKFRNKV